MQLKGFLVGAMLIAMPAVAEDLIAVRPGLMCQSADALAKLTLPNGDSRTHTPSARPGDQAIAANGGCLDIQAGARVTVQQSFKNTSIVTYGSSGTLTVPNIDFRSADTPGAAVVSARGPASPGYSVVQHVPTGDSAATALEILEDQRITPALRTSMWSVTDDPVMILGDDPRADAFKRQPLLPARLRLMSPAGTVLAIKPLDQPLATIEPAPIHGLPWPAFLLTVDDSTGTGSYNGPTTQILTPADRQLEPAVSVDAASGAGDPIFLSDSLKAAWKIVPSRSGGPEEIEAVASRVNGNDEFATVYRTYRFTGGRWVVSARQQAEIWEHASFPARELFP